MARARPQTKRARSASRPFCRMDELARQAAVEADAASAFCAALAAAAAASSLRMSDSRFCTSDENTYCAGRCLVRSISGAIGPEVFTPRIATHIALNGLLMASSAAVG